MRYTLSLLVAVAAAVQGAQQASVWTFDRSNSVPQTSRPSISPENARLLLAHRLGLSSYHSLKNADENTISLLNIGEQKSLFDESSDGAGRKLLVIVEGLEDERKDYQQILGAN